MSLSLSFELLNPSGWPGSPHEQICREKNQSKGVLRLCTWLPSIHAHTHTHTNNVLLCCFFSPLLIDLLFISCDQQNSLTYCVCVWVICQYLECTSQVEKSCEWAVGLAAADERVRRSWWAYNPLLVHYGLGPPPFPSEGSHICLLEHECFMDCFKPAHSLTQLVSIFYATFLKGYFAGFSVTNLTKGATNEQPD